MKKSVILTISVIYIIAIVVVGFIGIRMKIYNANIYVDSITCISDNYHKYEEGSDGAEAGYDGYIHTNYVDGLKVLIKFKINPDNATEKKLEYIYDTNSTIFTIIDNGDGTAYINFLKAGSATIIIKSTDNKGVKIKIKINAVDIGDIV